MPSVLRRGSQEALLALLCGGVLQQGVSAEPMEGTQAALQGSTVVMQDNVIGCGGAPLLVPKLCHYHFVCLCPRRCLPPRLLLLLLRPLQGQEVLACNFAGGGACVFAGTAAVMIRFLCLRVCIRDINPHHWQHTMGSNSPGCILRPPYSTLFPIHHGCSLLVQ